jgi:hypothetical protein
VASVEGLYTMGGYEEGDIMAADQQHARKARVLQTGIKCTTFVEAK